MSLPLQNKRAFITGGSRGIGAAIVKHLASLGANVAFTYVSKPDDARQTAADAQALGVRAIPLLADSLSAPDLSAAIDHAARSLGGIDILVNNAGIAVIAPVEQLSLESFDRTFNINVRAAFVATQAALRYMPDGSRIINIGSANADRMPFAGGSAYATSKAALVGLAKGLARDLGPRNITVNNIQPGPVETDMNPANGPFAETLKAFMAIPRYARPDEIAALVAYLAGPHAALITGASLTIDGGFTA